MKREKKYFGRFKESLTEMPNLVESQIQSFNWLVEKGLGDLFSEFTNLKDYSEKKFELSFTMSIM
jgi:DNA-directed RNA polymerase subunit beta